MPVSALNTTDLPTFGLPASTSVSTPSRASVPEGWQWHSASALTWLRGTCWLLVRAFESCGLEVRCDGDPALAATRPMRIAGCARRASATAISCRPLFSTIGPAGMRVTHRRTPLGHAEAQRLTRACGSSTVTISRGRRRERALERNCRMRLRVRRGAVALCHRTSSLDAGARCADDLACTNSVSIVHILYRMRSWRCQACRCRRRRHRVVAARAHSAATSLDSKEDPWPTHLRTSCSSRRDARGSIGAAVVALEIRGDRRRTHGVLRDRMRRGARRHARPPSHDGLTGEARSRSGLTGGDARRVARAGPGSPASDFTDAVAAALATAEVNAAMGRIVAAPTGGASGVLPAVLLTVAKRGKAPPTRRGRDALFVAGGFGGDHRGAGDALGRGGRLPGRDRSGGGDGCGCGGRSCSGGTPEQAATPPRSHCRGCSDWSATRSAASSRCRASYRNATGAAVALASAEMALAGVEFPVPFDEVVDRHAHVGPLAAPLAARDRPAGSPSRRPAGASPPRTRALTRVQAARARDACPVRFDGENASHPLRRHGGRPTVPGGDAARPCPTVRHSETLASPIRDAGPRSLLLRGHATLTD